MTEGWFVFEEQVEKCRTVTSSNVEVTVTFGFGNQ